LDETALLRNWETGKRTRAFQRLCATTAAEFEFRTRVGHPSSYALVRLEAAPADQLTFRSTARWPAAVSPEEARYFESAVAEGLVDVLFAVLYPYRGCSVTLTEVRYDAVGSSYVAFRAAAMKASERLVQDAAWETVADQRHR
jgi:hypothetical protein